MSDFSFTAFNYRWAYTAQSNYEVERNVSGERLKVFVNADAATAHDVRLAAMKA
jgi:hypothetical protein